MWCNSSTRVAYIELLAALLDRRAPLELAAVAYNMHRVTLVRAQCKQRTRTTCGLHDGRLGQEGSVCWQPTPLTHTRRTGQAYSPLSMPLSISFAAHAPLSTCTTGGITEVFGKSWNKSLTVKPVAISDLRPDSDVSHRPHSVTESTHRKRPNMCSVRALSDELSEI